jgi:hypothetical protein
MKGPNVSPTPCRCLRTLPTTEAEERSARAHSSDLQKVAHYYNQLIKKQVAWKSHHPHQHHLGSVETHGGPCLPRIFFTASNGRLVRAPADAGRRSLITAIADCTALTSMVRLCLG